MMKRIITYILLPLFLCGCSEHEEQPGPAEQPTGTTQINFSLKVEDMHTRSEGEGDISEKVDNIEVLAFEEIEGNYTYTYRATAQRTETGNQYEYSVALRPTGEDVNVTLLIIANHTDFQELQVGFSIQETMEVLLHPFTADKINWIPMYGKINITGGVNSGTTIDPITLLRSVAAVEVILGDDLSNNNNFSLETIQVYRANNLIQIIPGLSSPSVPQGASNNITTLPVNAEEVTNTTPIYLPESKAPAPENITKEATCLIIGGIYRENNQDTNNPTTYYRVDFGKDTNIGQILRNHLYTIKITEVAGPGTAHPDEAVDTYISTIIYEWGDSNHNIEL